MQAADIFGLPIPDAGPVFTTALAVHIAGGFTAVAAGALDATARKQPGLVLYYNDVRHVGIDVDDGRVMVAPPSAVRSPRTASACATSTDRRSTASGGRVDQPGIGCMPTR